MVENLMSIGENLKFLDHSLTEREKNVSSSYLLKKSLNFSTTWKRRKIYHCPHLFFFTISRWSLYRIHRLHVASKVLYVSIATIAQHPQRLQLAIT